MTSQARQSRLCVGPEHLNPVGDHHGTCGRHRPRHHQLRRRRPRGRRAHRHRERRGRPHDPVRRRVHQERRGARRRDRQAPGRHQRRPDHPLGQAPHGHRLEVARDRRQEVHRRRRSAPASCRSSSATPRPTSARRSPTPSSPSPRTSTTPSARPPRRPARSRASTSCASSTSRPRPRSPTASTRARRTSSSSSSTSVAARSTSPCSRWARTRTTSPPSRSARPPVTTTSVATTGTSAIVDHLLTTVKNTTGVDLSKDKIAMQRLREAAEQAKKELSHRDEHQHLAAVPLDDRERPDPPRRDAHPRAVRADDQGPARPHQGAVPPGHQGRRHQASATSTTSCSSAARPACRPSPRSSRS